jgi:hypothetical protein
MSQLDVGIVQREAVGDAVAGERAARRSLRAQIAKLERDLSAMVADGFPHIAPIASAAGPQTPRLLDLAELEQLRDRLAGRAQQLRARVLARERHERAAHELLVDMKRNPSRHKFTRLPVRELGQGGCGAWEVRPRLGLIGMLAGWWQLKLSSGCPLSRDVRAAGARLRAGPPGLLAGAPSLRGAAQRVRGRA